MSIGFLQTLGVPTGWVVAPMGAGGPYGWMRTGISLGGRWAAPLGAGTHVEQVGIGCPWVLGLPMGQKALGCTLSPAPYGGVLGAPMGAGGPPELHPPLQRSLEDELSRTTAQDLPVFAVSYLLVFLYVALALGEYTAWRRVWVRGDGGGGTFGC